MHKTVLVSTDILTEPLSISEVQDHLKVSGELDYLNSLIKVSRRQIERYLNRVLITQSWKVYYDNWCDEMKIPFGSLQINEDSPVVSYRDLEGDLIELDNVNYWTVNTEDPAKIVRAYSVTYPEVQYGRPDAIEIAFTAGYGDSASDIPDEIKHAMKLLITNMYEHRGDVVIGSIAYKIPHYITDLIHTYKLYEF